MDLPRPGVKHDRPAQCCLELAEREPTEIRQMVQDKHSKHKGARGGVLTVSQRCAILLAMATSAAFAAAQQPASEPRLPSGQQPNAYTLQVKAQEIVLDLVVTDSKGEP